MKISSDYYCLKTVAPVSIGCDEVYEPISFVIDEDKKELVNFSVYSFLEQLDSDTINKFSNICQKGTIESLLEIMSFIYSHRHLADGERCALASDLIAHYRNTLNLPLIPRVIQENLNRFKIDRTAFNLHTGLPYIPGSAIKGALRTAVLNLRNRHGLPSRGSRKGSDLEQYILSYDFKNLESDPFRLVKVSDFLPVDEIKRKIVYAVDRKKRPSEKEAQALYQILEVIEPGACFVGNITTATPDRRSPVKKPISREELLESLSMFYLKEKRREDQEIRSIGGQLMDIQFSPKDRLLRIGRHSGAECITIEGHRHIKVSPPGKKPFKFEDHATTLWLASELRKPLSNTGLIPFGWSLLMPISANKSRELKKKAMFLQSKRQDAQYEKVKSHLLAVQKKALELEARRVEEAKRELEKKTKEARRAQQRQIWESMTQEEQDLACIRGESIARQYALADVKDPIKNIWSKIDSIPPTNQKVLAQAFKEQWQGREDKWKKKKCSKKQWKKVQKIKEILGKS